MDIIKSLAETLKIREPQLRATVELIDGGDTIPFIARYRKEVTGSLDDQLLRELFDRLTYLRNLEKRKEEVRSSIESQGKLTDEIVAALEAALTLAEVEDIYRPYKQKKKTRASVARERGLEPLADIIFAQNLFDGSVEEIAAQFIDEEKGVADADAAISGACDIIAEIISDNAEYRKQIRSMTFEYGILSCKKIKDDDLGKVYAMYFDYNEPIKAIPNHRILAVNRAEKEDYIRVNLIIEPLMPINYIFNQVVPERRSITTKYVERASIDAYERLISPSIEREIRGDAFDGSCESGIKVFAENLKNLLMSPPLKGKTVLGFDPGFRTGCKLSVVDKTGKVCDTGVIYPTKPQEKTAESEKAVTALIKKHGVDVIAIGNGTASKESEIFIAGLLKKIGGKTKYIIVSESGASVYSASKLGAEEFPEFDVTLRSAVSIARRLQDPLAELVKIDPKSIGVGQYQHDMKESRLDEALTGVVEDCVNAVGVDVNTASYSLLSYVAGINAAAAKNIVKFRDESGEFKTRDQLKKVPRIGAKAFEQCAGFMRIPSGADVLDNTGVHPESYKAARELLTMFGLSTSDVRDGKISGLAELVKQEGANKIAEKLGVGVPTLHDIVKELEKPGRDIRSDFPEPILRDDIMDLADLQVGMKLTGTVRNVIDFGAFVDIGVHQDGLVHVSEISNKYIKHPSEVLSVGDIVTVTVLSVDKATKRISLSIKR